MLVISHDFAGRLINPTLIKKLTLISAPQKNIKIIEMQLFSIPLLANIHPYKEIRGNLVNFQKSIATE